MYIRTQLFLILWRSAKASAWRNRGYAFAAMRFWCLFTDVAFCAVLLGLHKNTKALLPPEIKASSSGVEC